MVQLLGLQGPWWCQALRESGSHGDGRYRHEIWFTSITYSGELVWLSGIRRACLCSFNSIQTATDQLLHSWEPQMPPSLVPTNCSDVGISPLLQLPRSQVQVSPAHPLLFLSFLHPTEFCVDLYIPFCWLRASSWVMWSHWNLCRGMAWSHLQVTRATELFCG